MFKFKGAEMWRAYKFGNSKQPMLEQIKNLDIAV